MTKLPEPMAAISIAELTVRFGAVLAVDNASLDVGDGEFVSIVGPSGCGKTTILNLSGLPGQRVRASRLDEQSHLVTADVVDHRLDPRQATVLTGRSATVRATDGQQGIAAHLDLAWVEAVEPPHTANVSSPANATPTSTTPPAVGASTTTSGSANGWK